MPGFARGERRRPLVTTALLILLVLAGACQAAGNQPTGGDDTPGTREVMETSPLQIQQVDVRVAKGLPAQVSVDIVALIPDACTTARAPGVERQGNAFTIQVLGDRPRDRVCAQVVTEYRATADLGTLGPGAYTVRVNDVTRDFQVS